MQVVGMNCWVCSKPIGFASEGHACVSCVRGYHTACIQAGKICPSCGEDLEHQAATLDRQERKATAACLRAGRIQFLVAVALLLALMTFDVAASLLRRDSSSVMGFNPGVGMLVTIGLLVAVYTGRFWARVLVGCQLVLGVVVQVGFLCRIARSAGLIGALISSWVLLIVALCLVILCFSPSVSLYLESHRTPGGGD
jgi:hypothetical protein